MRPTGRLSPGFVAAKRYAQREILVHPQNGSTVGIRLQVVLGVTFARLSNALITT
jgi:hypothetical protein